ncbi:Lrp/AsnC family transcriptional regulator [Bacillus sp. 03113]|uniref:Lrp/AsnC family transcriptional regulator n=1 Tax=Bacillus sp. 03113 TaxID=2578211 RepID=UPI0015E8BD34|nr:Lrp/AsnC family transcriptional regulator [Bacillus sp. 03113]
MDTFDHKILQALMKNARVRWADLAVEIGLSAPATAERVNRLVERGVIKGYTAFIDTESVGCECTAFVSVTLDRPQHREAFLEIVKNLSEIQECHHTAGDGDYLLKIRCKNTKDLDRVISFEIKNLPGIVRTKTTIVMDTIKETMEVPLQPTHFHE